MHTSNRENFKNESNKIAPFSKSECRTFLRDNIYQSNPLIQARKHMSNIELKLFILSLQGVNPHISLKDKYYDKDFQPVFISTKQLNEIFGHTQYLTEIKKACENLFSTSVKFEFKTLNNESAFILCHVFSMIKYVEKKGLYILFDQIMKPYILDLYKSKGYTYYSAKQIFKLSSVYAIRLCELILQFKGAAKHNLIERTISVEDLRFSLNISDNAYARMDHFKKIVLDLPIKEICKKTDYIVWYNTIKKGRKIIAFTFYMDIAKAVEQERELMANRTKDNSLSFYDTIPAIKLHELGFSNEAAMAMLDKCENGRDLLNRLLYAIDCFNSSTKLVDNKLGFIRKAIEDNWLAKHKLDEKENDEVREIWRQTKINGTTVEQEVLKHFEETLPINPDNKKPVKRFLRPPEVRSIQFAIANRDPEKIVAFMQLLDDLNWTWDLFKSHYDIKK